MRHEEQVMKMQTKRKDDEDVFLSNIAFDKVIQDE